MKGDMRAVVVRAPMNYEVETVPVPATPKGGLLLTVDACGLCGSDLRTLRNGHLKVTFPWTIGHEIAGEVVELSPSYKGSWEVGDKLAIGPLAYCGVCDFCIDGKYELCISSREIGQHWPGGFAEYVGIPEPCLRLGTIQRKPEGLDPAFAAISEPMSSCVSAHEKAETGLGETVVIIGTGPVGCIHASLARARGADRIFMADIVDERLDMAKPFGPDATINAATVDLVQEVARLTEGRGPEVVITATPAPVATRQAVQMARRGGRVMVFGGLPKHNSQVNIDMNVVHYNALHLIGVSTFAPRHQRRALAFMKSGRIPMDKLVTHRFPLESFVEGAKQALEGQVLKAVFLP
ncbi:MAG: alcohol dehydrogenase catalytic domain-containing protein [Anaerolineae bacterium]|jgi:L-iditol 2-dehydrogenase